MSHSPKRSEKRSGRDERRRSRSRSRSRDRDRKAKPNLPLGERLLGEMTYVHDKGWGLIEEDVYWHISNVTSKLRQSDLRPRLKVSYVRERNDGFKIPYKAMAIRLPSSSRSRSPRQPRKQEDDKGGKRREEDDRRGGGRGREEERRGGGRRRDEGRKRSASPGRKTSRRSSSRSRRSSPPPSSSSAASASSSRLPPPSKRENSPARYKPQPRPGSLSPRRN